jgi:hypothetical protein
VSVTLQEIHLRLDSLENDLADELEQLKKDHSRSLDAIRRMQSKVSALRVSLTMGRASVQAELRGALPNAGRVIELVSSEAKAKHPGAA